MTATVHVQTPLYSNATPNIAMTLQFPDPNATLALAAGNTISSLYNVAFSNSATSPITVTLTGDAGNVQSALYWLNTNGALAFHYRVISTVAAP